MTESAESLQSSLVVAPLPHRFLALIIDVAIALLALPITLFVESGSQAANAFQAAISATYYIGFLIAKSATPGKLALGLYVGDRNGGLVQANTAMVRYAAFDGPTYLLAVEPVALLPLVGLIFLASLLMTLIDKRRRALHDRIAGTVVYKGRPPESISSYGEGFPRL